MLLKSGVNSGKMYYGQQDFTSLLAFVTWQMDGAPEKPQVSNIFLKCLHNNGYISLILFKNKRFSLIFFYKLDY